MPQEVLPQKGRAVRLVKRIFSLLRVWFLLPLAGALIGTTIITRLASRILAPDSYKIYVVGDMSKSVAAQKIAHAFEICGLKDFHGVALDIVRRNDEGQPSQARQLAQSISRQPDTLMVIGHAGSGQTKEALPIYLAAKPPVPVILTTETTPNLVPEPVKPGTYMPVLRLWPTDREQARIAARFIAKRARAEQGSSAQNAIWVVQDVSGDKVYSEFLANEFIRDVQRKGNVKVVLWSTNLATPSVHALRALDIGWVFFAGNWPAALVLIRELKAVYPPDFGQQMPSIVLSDACMDQRLIDEGGLDVKDVFLTFPMKVSAGGKRETDRGGKEYAEHADDVCTIVRALLEEADYGPDVYRLAEKEGGIGYQLRSLFAVKRVKDARLLLGSRMESAEDQAESFTLGNGSKIRFARKDQDGEVGARVDADATFYIWQVHTGAGSVNSEQEDFADYNPAN